MTKIKLITLDPTLPKWKSYQDKITEIISVLNTIKNGNFEIDTEYLNLIPEVKDGYITHEWMDTISRVYWDAGYDFVAIHFNKKSWIKHKLKLGLRGAYQNDQDKTYELYFWADEKTKREGLNQFIQTFLHEISHGLARSQGVPDITHPYHNLHRDITGLFKTYTMDSTEMKASLLRSLWAKVAELKTQLASLSSTPGVLPLVKRRGDAVIADMRALGYEMRITQGYRSIEAQNALYAQGRTKPGKIVTNAKGGDSYHNYGCALDFVFRKEGYNVPETVWQTFGIIGEKHGFAWGGRWTTFKDMPHLEMTLGYSLDDFKSGRVDYKKFN